MKIYKRIRQKTSEMNPYDQFRYNMVYTCIVAVSVVFTIVAIYMYVAKVNNFEIALGFIAVAILLQFLNLYLLYKGHYWFVTYSILITSWSAVAYGLWLSGGLYASAVMFMPIVLIGTLLLIGIREAIILTILTFVYMMALYIAEVQGYLPVVPNKDLPYRILIIGVSFSTLMLIVGYYVLTLHQMQERNIELNIMTERNRIFRQLTQDIAHDLRTPVASLIATMYILKRRQEQNQPIDRYIDKLEISSIRMNDMIEDFLQLALLDEVQTQRAVIANTIDLYPILQQAIEANEGALATKQISLHFDEHPASYWVHGDAVQLKRVFTNLIENAINYGKENGFLNVIVNTQPPFYDILIQDNGIGIAADEQDKIFERFYRANKARTTPKMGAGNGIGLSIVKRLVELHDGSIHVESQEGIGSTFTVRLPIADPSSTT